jgi:hypothetical protein
MSRLIAVKELPTHPTHGIPVCKSTVFRLIRSGHLKTVHIGRRVFVTEDSLIAYVEGLIEERA